ncbi:hypothetical protein CLRAG_31980 [Clostridium ragsdalei P11]|uniref:Uncharacterized protein n=1 Tax=Clostridium ragsdalei P11 TaxID=1353534 RepID=A0A1A6AMH5_9CLOT|nr:hypothetical protein [Clostridium ragsdalei]OBR91256.1 hypothetical protein CLRAG_31980 [Clostridium ragsdalei P11]
MKKIWKKVSFVMMLTFTLMIFVPYTAMADTAQITSTPSLSQDAGGNYTVSSVDDLNKLRKDIDNGIDYSGKTVFLTQDIDISKSTAALNSFTTSNEFNGTFNGNFHTISNYNDAKSGLFAVICKNTIIENVRIDADVVIKDGKEIITTAADLGCLGDYGLIANEGDGTITRCSSTGTITTKDGFGWIAGIVGCNTRQKRNSSIIYPGCVEDCYSNVTFNNQSSGQSKRAGICGYGGKVLDHCYFYGKFTGNYTYQKDGIDVSTCNPIVNLAYYDSNARVMTSEATCAYDKDVVGDAWNERDTSIDPKAYTTEEMQNKDTYTAMGFDFDKTWKIDSSINGGYPYLNSGNIVKQATKVVLDLQVTAADKMYDTSASVAKNLRTTITNINLVPEDNQYNDLIGKYNVKVSYGGNADFSAPTIGETPVKLSGGDFKITYDTNDEYQFVVGKVSVSNARLKDNGAAAPTETEEKQQIENAKKAEDILYSKLASKLGIDKVNDFSWSGDKASREGKEGTIVFSDSDWGVFSSARSGYSGIKPGFYDDWFKSIQTGLQKMKDAGIQAQDVKMTEWEKLVLAITSIGYDPRDIKAYDLLNIISNKAYLKASVQYFTPQYADFALTSYNYIDYVSKDGNHITQSDLEADMHGWAKISPIAADGSIGPVNAVPDMRTMVYQPITAYYDPDAKPGDKYYDVKQAIDYEFNHISNSQTYLGSFYGGYDYNNPWTNAQVYINLGMAHVNIFDKKYIKNGQTILDGALKFYDIEKGTTTFDDSTYDPSQMCRGLDSLVRAYEGRNSIFDCTDVKNSTVPVNNAIAALPDVGKLTSADKDKVDAVEKLYDALSDAQKSSMKQETVGKLTEAEKKVSGSQDETKPIKITNLTKDSSFKLGDDAKVSVKAENNSGKDQDASLLVALYDENGKFINYVCGKQMIKNGDSSILTGIMKLPEEGIYKIKAFIWDSLENMNPLSNVIDVPVQSNK